jgi:hypothetical protein
MISRGFQKGIQILTLTQREPTGSAPLFEGSKETHYEEAIPMKLTSHRNKWSVYLVGKNSTQGGDR